MGFNSGLAHKFGMVFIDGMACRYPLGFTEDVARKPALDFICYVGSQLEYGFHLRNGSHLTNGLQNSVGS